MLYVRIDCKRAQDKLTSPNLTLNYFDSSTFLGQHPTEGFFAQKALLGHYNGAAKIHMIAPTPHDLEEDQKRKESFSLHWKNWRACLDLAKTKPEKTAFHTFLRKPDDFLGFIYEIPKEILIQYFHSYQAYLWNKIVERAATRKSPSQDFFNLEIPLFHEKSKMPDAFFQTIEAEVLAEEKIDRFLFEKTKFRKVQFRPGLRPLLKP